MTKHATLIAALVLSLGITQLQGCAVAVVGAGAAAAKVANDRRTVGTQLDDQNAESAIAYQWSKSEDLKAQANLQADVYNGVALITGQVPSEQMRTDAIARVQNVDYVKKIHNQLRVGEPIGASQQATDIWLASKVKTKLVADERVPALQVRVVVQNAEVFLMGRVSNLEATAAVDIARHVGGVQRVVRAFEIM